MPWIAGVSGWRISSDWALKVENEADFCAALDTGSEWGDIS